MTTPYTTVGGVNYRGNVPKPSGVFNPSKYPVAPGKNYGIFGEQKGWVYNPYNDTYVPDPKAQHDYAVQQGLATDPKPAPGLAETILPVAGVVAATELAREGGKGVAGLFGAGGAAKDVAQTGLANTAGAQVTASTAANAGANAAAGANQSTGLFLGPGGAPTGAGAELQPSFGTGGSLYNTSGMIGPEGSIAPLNVAGAALGTYGVYKASQAQNKRQGVASGALSGAGAGMSIGGPVGAGIGAVVGGLFGAAAHETTKHRTTRRFGELGSSNTDNAGYQSLVNQGAQESLSGADTWDKGDDKSQAPIEMMTRGYGVLKTFGPEWSNYTEQQRQAITKALVDNDLINSKQGDWLVDDQAKAKSIRDQVLSGKYGQTTPAGLMMANNKVATVNPPLGQPGHQWQPGDPVYGRR